ncbi:delta-12 fatty acid desaturase [Panus rudis PR-1116 ss-1]|nr:delta-12 fatty acid desaturase [Panus rudis PR-1116 ss-1]
MAKLTHANGRTTIEQAPVVIPDLSIKDLLSAIPAHCYKRSALRSSVYVVWDFFLLAVIYKGTVYLDALLTPEHISLPSPYLYTFASFALWALYSFATGLVATGLWVIAHECGHQAFSESKLINNTVGWILHSALGVPYHSWRITHAKHHASTAHMTQDQVFVPKTRSQRGLPEFNPAKEDLGGASIADEVMKELYDALGDSPIGATIGAASYLLAGWPMYLLTNASGQKRYPEGTNHFNPKAVMFSPHHFGQIVVSDIGIFIWLGAVIYSIRTFGFFEVFRTYLVPYLWVNHWLVLITFLQHTDPIVPHYRASEFTFPRGALATLDRNLLGDCGKIMGWIGAVTTHGISETHVAHHVSSKIPHYNAWEATYALRKRLAQAGIVLQGRPGGWAEVYRVFKECKFVEDEGDILFYKNAYGLAASRPVLPDHSASDSGIEMVDNKEA